MDIELHKRVCGMINKSLLAQARKGQDYLIKENPETFTYTKNNTPTIPIGWDGSSTTAYTFEGRLSHETSIIPQAEGNQAGMSTNLKRFFTCGYLIDYLQRDDIITDSKGKDWKLGVIDPLEKFGGIYGYQAWLYNAG